MKDLINVLNKFRTRSSKNLRDEQIAYIPHLNLDQIEGPVKSYIKDGKRELFNSSEYICLKLNYLNNKKVISRSNMRDYLEQKTSMQTLINNDVINPFMLFIDGVFIPWSLIYIYIGDVHSYLFIRISGSTGSKFAALNIYKGNNYIVELPKDMVYSSNLSVAPPTITLSINDNSIQSMIFDSLESAKRYIATNRDNLKNLTNGTHGVGTSQAFGFFMYTENGCYLTKSGKFIFVNDNNKTYDVVCEGNLPTTIDAYTTSKKYLFFTVDNVHYLYIYSRRWWYAEETISEAFISSKDNPVMISWIKGNSKPSNFELLGNETYDTVFSFDENGLYVDANNSSAKYGIKLSQESTVAYCKFLANGDNRVVGADIGNAIKNTDKDISKIKLSTDNVFAFNNGKFVLNKEYLSESLSDEEKSKSPEITVHGRSLSVKQEVPTEEVIVVSPYAIITEDTTKFYDMNFRVTKYISIELYPLEIANERIFTYNKKNYGGIDCSFWGDFSGVKNSIPEFYLPDTSHMIDFNKIKLYMEKIYNTTINDQRIIDIINDYLYNPIKEENPNISSVEDMMDVFFGLERAPFINKFIRSGIVENLYIVFKAFIAELKETECDLSNAEVPEDARESIINLIKTYMIETSLSFDFGINSADYLLHIIKFSSDIGGIYNGWPLAEAVTNIISGTRTMIGGDRYYGISGYFATPSYLTEPSISLAQLAYIPYAIHQLNGGLFLGDNDDPEFDNAVIMYNASMDSTPIFDIIADLEFENSIFEIFEQSTTPISLLRDYLYEFIDDSFNDVTFSHYMYCIMILLTYMKVNVSSTGSLNASMSDMETLLNNDGFLTSVSQLAPAFENVYDINYENSIMSLNSEKLTKIFSKIIDLANNDKYKNLKVVDIFYFIYSIFISTNGHMIDACPLNTKIGYIKERLDYIFNFLSKDYTYNELLQMSIEFHDGNMVYNDLIGDGNLSSLLEEYDPFDIILDLDSEEFGLSETDKENLCIIDYIESIIEFYAFGVDTGIFGFSLYLPLYQYYKTYNTGNSIETRLKTLYPEFEEVADELFSSKRNKLIYNYLFNGKKIDKSNLKYTGAYNLLNSVEDVIYKISGQQISVYEHNQNDYELHEYPFDGSTIYYSNPDIILKGIDLFLDLFYNKDEIKQVVYNFIKTIKTTLEFCSNTTNQGFLNEFSGGSLSNIIDLCFFEAIYNLDSYGNLPDEIKQILNLIKSDGYDMSCYDSYIEYILDISDKVNQFADKSVGEIPEEYVVNGENVISTIRNAYKNDGAFENDSEFGKFYISDIISKYVSYIVEYIIYFIIKFNYYGADAMFESHNISYIQVIDEIEEFFNVSLIYDDEDDDEVCLEMQIARYILDKLFESSEDSAYPDILSELMDKLFTGYSEQTVMEEGTDNIDLVVCANPNASDTYDNYTNLNADQLVVVDGDNVMKPEEEQVPYYQDLFTGYDTSLNSKKSYKENLTNMINNVAQYNSGIFNELLHDKSNLEIIEYTGAEVNTHKITTEGSSLKNCWVIPRKHDEMVEEYMMLFVNGEIYQHSKSIQHIANACIIPIADIDDDDIVELFRFKNINNNVYDITLSADDDYDYYSPDIINEDMIIFSDEPNGEDAYEFPEDGKQYLPIEYSIERSSTNPDLVKIVLESSKYYGKPLKVAYKNRYVHATYRIRTADTKYAIDLTEQFKYCYDYRKFMVFLNGRKVDSKFYRPVLPSRETTPFFDLKLYFSLDVKKYDVIDVFYLPSLMNDVYFEPEQAISGNIIVDKSVLDYGLKTDMYIVWINGKKIPASQIDNMSPTMLHINSDQQTTKNLSITKYMPDVKEILKDVGYTDEELETMKFFGNTNSKFDQLMSNIDIGELYTMLRLDSIELTDSEADIADGAIDIKHVMYELLREQYAMNPRVDITKKFVYDYLDVDKTAATEHDNEGDIIFAALDANTDDNILGTPWSEESDEGDG